MNRFCLVRSRLLGLSFVLSGPLNAAIRHEHVRLTINQQKRRIQGYEVQYP